MSIWCNPAPRFVFLPNTTCTGRSAYPKRPIVKRILNPVEPAVQNTSVQAICFLTKPQTRRFHQCKKAPFVPRTWRTRTLADYTLKYFHEFNSSWILRLFFENNRRSLMHLSEIPQQRDPPANCHPDIPCNRTAQKKSSLFFLWLLTIFFASASTPVRVVFCLWAVELTKVMRKIPHFGVGIVWGTIPSGLPVLWIIVPGCSRNSYGTSPNLWVQKKLVKLWQGTQDTWLSFANFLREFLSDSPFDLLRDLGDVI